MKLKISNFAKIEEADIKIDGITVICGDNDTGKSTIGKILFSIFNHDNFKKLILEEDLKYKIFNILKKLNIKNKFGVPIFIPKNSPTIDKIYNYINDLSKNISSKDLINILKNTIEKKYIIFVDDDTFDEIAKDILEIISTKNNKLMFEIMTDYFGNIFENQINNLFNKNSNAELALEIKKQKMNIEFKNDECIKFESDFNIIHNAFYIDNPFIVNYVNSDIDTDNFILKKTIDDFFTNDNKNIFDSVKNKEILEKVYDVLNSVMNAKIVNKDDDFYLH